MNIHRPQITRLLLLLPLLAGLSSSADLVAHWRLDETSGTTATDSGPHHLDGAYQGTYAVNQPGPFGTAVDFDGTDGEVYKSAASPLWNLQNDFTLTAWINGDTLNGTSGTQRILSSTGGQWGFGLANDSLQFTAYGIIDATAGSTHIAQDTWTHVAVGVSADNYASFFVNGVFIQTLDLGQPTHQDTNANWFVASSGTGEYFDGTIDEVQVYDTELSEAQILQIANTNAIPEPSSALLFLFGNSLVLFAFIRYARQRNTASIR